MPASDKFTFKELTRIEGEPNYAAVANLKRECFTNLQAVHSLRGNGRLGLSVLVLGDAECNRLANPNGGVVFNWVAPVHPGPAPVFPNGATAAASARIQEQHKRDVDEFHEINEAEASIKQIVLEAIEENFILSLRHPAHGFANVSTRQIIEHLEANYTTLDQDQLAENLQTLALPWEPANTMEPLWQRAVAAQEVAQHGGEPIAEVALLRIFRQTIIDTGLFALDVRDWDKRPADERTWVNFKTFFSDANKKRCKEMTAGQLQHGAFKAVNDPNASRPGSPQHASRPGAPDARSAGASPLATSGTLADFAH